MSAAGCDAIVHDIARVIGSKLQQASDNRLDRAEGCLGNAKKVGCSVRHLANLVMIRFTTQMGHNTQVNIFRGKKLTSVIQAG